MSADRLPIDRGLLAILACPEDRGPLVVDVVANLLRNPRLGRSYPSEGGIPRLTLSAVVPGGPADGTPAASGPRRCRDDG